jgi:hypothetical protein|tara:strand:+ start:2232 stop:2408 length:177 start_codon:yes stop_codon:yes gene_type:complete
MDDHYCNELNSFESDRDLGWYDEWSDDENYETVKDTSRPDDISWWVLYQEGCENEKTE